MPKHTTYVECTVDDNCPNDRFCKNERCLDPCTYDSPCGRGAFCHADKHRPVCKCPAGFTGNAKINCIPRKYILHLFRPEYAAIFYMNISYAFYVQFVNIILLFQRSNQPLVADQVLIVHYPSRASTITALILVIVVSTPNAVFSTITQYARVAPVILVTLKVVATDLNVNRIRNAAMTNNATIMNALIHVPLTIRVPTMPFAMVQIIEPLVAVRTV